MSNLLKIPLEQQEDLALLFTLPSSDIVEEFAKSSIQFLKNAPQNIQLTFQKVSSHLGSVSKQQVEQTIKGLSNLFTTATKKGLNEESFMLSLKQSLDIQKINSLIQKNIDETTIDETIALLTAIYSENKNDLAPLFKEQQFGNHYLDLKWRLETQVASRKQKDLIQPRYLFSLETTDKEPITFQVKEYSDLKRITEKLDNALKDLKTTHAKRIKNYIH